MNHFTRSAVGWLQTAESERELLHQRPRRAAPPAGRRLRPAQAAPRTPHTPPHPSHTPPHPSHPPDTDQFTASLCAVPPPRTRASSLNEPSKRLTLHKELLENNEFHLNIDRNTLQ
ncbi:unnamed protein product [Danaus chrysippus]|uniref:(African queen) hypothetical protein n=1 Tax=Danaus chrysippus TaxID=151541 RepID=A0A8J2VY26_9NEOP|nr:unnamed protein product [Danaus chrysippus]